MSPTRAGSFFSYGISRSFPFRWFTPVALISLLVFAALFSFLNYLSTGFLLDVEISTNPNATMQGETWLRSWPSFIFNMHPICQAASLPVGSQFFTNQTALMYTLSAVWQQNGSTESLRVLPSLTYFNNVLEHCTISFIGVEIEALDRTANQIAYPEWGEVVRTFATCSIPAVEGRTWFNITQEYDYVPPTISYSALWDTYSFLGGNFLERNEVDKTSLWWGESLMSTYWGIVSGAMQLIWASDRDDATPGIRKGALSFSPQYVTENIMSDEYFKIDFRFIIDNGPIDGYTVIHPGVYDYDTNQNNGLELLRSQNAYPNIWNWTDRLAKSAYSTILVDLGQVSTKHVLSSATALRHYTQVFDTIDSENQPFIANARPGPATASYDGTGSPLKITPSVITTEYLCQVPKRKSILNLMVSILVADLVFLQVIWRLLTWGAESLLRKKPTSQYCEGCVKYIMRQAETDDFHPAGHDTGHISLHSFGSPSVHEDENGWQWHRSTSEQFLIPRPTFQRQFTDS